MNEEMTLTEDKGNENAIEHSAHVVKGCLIKYNVLWYNGETYVASYAFANSHNKRIPIRKRLLDRSCEIGDAILEHREDGVYYTAYLNNNENAWEAVRLIVDEDWRFGLFANCIRKDPDNDRAIIKGIIRSMGLTKHVDTAANVLYIDGKPLEEWRKKDDPKIVDKEMVVEQLEQIVADNPFDKRYSLVPEAIKLIKEGYNL